MPRSGPFTIDDKTYETRANGTIREVEPAIAEKSQDIQKKQLRRMKANKQVRLDEVTTRLTQLTARQAQLQQEIDDLDTLIANAAGAGPQSR